MNINEKFNTFEETMLFSKLNNVRKNYIYYHRLCCNEENIHVVKNYNWISLLNDKNFQAEIKRVFCISEYNHLKEFLVESYNIKLE